MRFNTQAYINDLHSRLLAAMLKLRNELLTEAKQGMLTPEGAESLTDGEIKDIVGYISVSVAGGAWAAMDEFGTGSWMDRSNPALKDYRGSPSWNPSRDDAKIRSRPDRPGQIDIFGNPVNGKGNGGVDLEALGIVEAQAPSRAIQTAVRWLTNGRVQKVIRDTVRALPYHKYLITDKR